jgi:hypothetical protein
MKLSATVMVTAAVVVLSCGSPTEGCGCSPAPVLTAGTWTAIQLLVTPAGQSQIDILAAGGSLTIVIAQNFTTSGSLVIPASVNGGTPFTASMAGTVAFPSSTLRATFVQAADTFVRDLSWEVTSGDTKLSVTNQTAGSASFTITLTKQ